MRSHASLTVVVVGLEVFTLQPLTMLERPPRQMPAAFGS